MKSAVLVIDVQCILFDKEPRPYEADEVIQRINAITHQARCSNVPVIFIQHEQAHTLLEYSSETWKLQSNLRVEGDDYKVRKTTPDSFLRTDLADLLSALSVDNLIICGYASEFCIDTTVRRAAALGYNVQLVADAHTTHDKKHAAAKYIREHHNATLSGISSFDTKISAVASEAVKL
ncbi:cysteine hydrolase family protein [Zooshikella ganghwensis]|uniref:Cysteine hydrolase n=1 Tax=Zooshikella ganghwensis TaxID=202772 RepID=A0A4P9VQT5_9GAMM|nr:cysteine hydrolase family protein [Zooshikella ganghwensis]RDH44947.1 cysteine hydrolase [Zooshikella ganghwensis]